MGDVNDLDHMDCGSTFTIDPDSSAKVRASITFRLGAGKGGTKSRDFPGRNFTQKERNLLQNWSSQWRSGASVHCNEDRRFINLASEQHGKRKAVLRKILIRRADAYEWFREKHVLLMSSMPIMSVPLLTDSIEQNTCDVIIDSFIPAEYQNGSSDPAHTEFIEIKWKAFANSKDV